MQQEIFDAIKAALEGLGAPEVGFVVERPADFSHGDYATNAALVAAKKLGKNPKEVATMLQELLKKFSEENGLAERSEEIRGPFWRKTFSEAVEKIEIAGPGFINFFLTKEAIGNTIAKKANGESWGGNNSLSGKKIIVEFTDPNPFKEFHIGHLMSNTIGEAISRTLEVSGAKVLRANYQGDVGLHVAKAIYGLLHMKVHDPSVEQLGLAYVDGSRMYDESEDAKKEIQELNKKIYNKSDEQINELYTKGRELSLEHFEELYKMLGTKFEYYFFESEMAAPAVKLVREHVGDVFDESDGAVVYKGEKDGLHTRVFINSLGLPTYEAKELALAFAKEEKQQSDELIIVTANEVNEYFKVVLAALGKISPALAAKIHHIGHGFLKLTTGKMSSRKGNVITGESLLMDLKDAAKEKIGERALENPDKVAEQVAVGAIKYAVLKQGSGRDIIFDPEKSLSLEGDSGPYLQYARVRALSLMARAQQAKKVAEEKSDYENFFASGASNTLARIVLHFPEVVEHAASELEPHFMTTYLTELAAAFNSWYASERVIVDGTVATAPLFLVMAVENTLSKGLRILGIPTPEEM